jgi:hypothetical protein
LKFSLTMSAVAISRSAASLRRLQVERDAFLVAVEHGEESGAGAEQPAGVVAGQRFDLDHLGAEVGQHHAAGRAHHHVGEFDDADAGVGQGGFAHEALISSAGAGVAIDCTFSHVL